MSEVDPHTEIERRFLVRSDEWRALAEPQRLVQGYLSTDSARVVRVRMDEASGWLTVKGGAAAGARTEIECEIPRETARAIIEHPAQLCVGTVIDKTRTRIAIGALTWEVDEFAGANTGLVIAEVEFTGGMALDEWHALVDAERPAWVGAEITADRRYANSALTRRPFAEWSDEERASALNARD
jgi:adenylate cyclase